MAAEPGKTASSAADAYIGSHISFLSKYDIRYEGVLYFLNPQDSTLGLKNVRSYGTEGRRKDGPQIPPNDKVYDYILFRGSDIKDLQVKSSPPAQSEELIHNDPAIIQSRFAGGPSTSSKSVSVGGSLTDFGALGDMSSLNMKTCTNFLPPHQSGNQAEPWTQQTIQNTSMSSYAMPTQRQGYSGIADNGTSQNSVQSSNQFLRAIENVFQAPPAHASTTSPLTYPSKSAAPGPTVVTSNPVHLSITDSLPVGQLSTSSSDLSSFSVKSSFPSHPEVLVGTRLSPSLVSSSSQIRSSIEAPTTNKVGSNPLYPHLLQSSYPVSSVVESSSGFSLNHPPRLLTPDQLSQPRVSEISSTQKLNLNQTDAGILSSSSLTASPAVQAPLLPLPPPSQKLQYSPEFAEEFDFEAMNEKFKKDEIWGYFGKAKQEDKSEHFEDNSGVGKNMGDGSLVTKVDAKPAYNKDDFFDTISRNLHSRGAGTGQNGFSQRMRLDTETFGNHQQGVHPGYVGYGAGRGLYNWRRGYHYGNRGRGRFPHT